MSGGYSARGTVSSGSGGLSAPNSASSAQEKLEEFAKKTLKEKIEEKKEFPKKRVFISYRFEDKGEVQALRSQAKNEGTELEFTDMGLKTPFDSRNVDYIKAGIRKRIESSSTTLVFLGKNTHESKWVNWEIEESIKQGKKIIIVNNQGSNPKLPPAAVGNSKIKVVPWKHSEIMNALHE